MEGDELLRVLHGHGFAGFVVEDYFVLGAVILEDAPDILEPGKREQEHQEDRDADPAVGHVGGEPPGK